MGTCGENPAHTRSKKSAARGPPIVRIKCGWR
jgi:hypothetical protein